MGGFTNKRPNPAAAAVAVAVDEEYSTTCRKRRKESESLESGEFPSDVVIGILSRLPVKTLFRFKSACKNWAAMVPTNPHLVSMHLKNYTNNPAAKASIVCAYHEDGSRIRRSVSLFPEGDPVPDLTFDLGERVVCCAGSGLLLLGKPNLSHPDYYLWNPATREKTRLPDPPLQQPPYPEHYPNYFGVGLDLVANDIKVVLICKYDANYYTRHSSKKPPPPPVFVYTLRSNCWSKLAAGSCCYDEEGWQELGRYTPTCHTYFKGFVYWFFKDYDKNAYVVAFDMGENLFHKINCPFDRRPRNCKLELYRDSIALFEGRWDYSSCKVWLLSRSSGQLCWIKYLKFDRFHERLSVDGCWNDDQLIARTILGSQLALYDTRGRKIKAFVPGYKRTMISCHINKDSLLLY